MPLSEHEQRLLDQLEQQLNAEDPTFASSMSSHRAGVGSQGALGARNLAIGVLVFLAGLGLILAGVSTKLILLGVLGFIVAVGGIYVVLMPQKQAKESASQKASGFAASQKTPKKQSGFMQNLESKWDERKFGGS